MTGPLLITLRDDGQLAIDGLVMEASEVRALAGDRAVALRGSQTLSYSQFTKAMDDLKGLNFLTAILGEGNVQ